MVLFSLDKNNQGVLYAYSTHPEAFGEHDLQVLELLAGQAAIALESAYLFEAEAQRRREAETLRETALVLTTTLELKKIFERMLVELKKVVPYDSVSVQLLKEDRLEIIDGRGFPNRSEIIGLSFPVEGDNPNREVVRRRDCFIVPDAPAMYRDFTKEPHIQADIRGWLGVPMLVGDKLIGMIVLDKREPEFYTKEHARLARAFATQAAIAIENARLYEVTKNQAEEMRLLYDLGVALNASLKLEEVLERIARSCQHLIQAETVTALVYDDGRDEYVQVGVSDKPENPIIVDEPRPNGYTKLIMDRGDPVIIQDVTQDKRIKPLVRESGLRSMAGIPIRLSGKAIGVLFVHSTVPHRFGDHEVTLVSFLANQAAVAIDNAWLYEETYRRQQLLTALDEASRQIRAEKETTKLLHQVVRLAAQLVDCPAGALCINRPHLGELELVATYGLPKELIRRRLSHTDGLTGLVAKTGQSQLIHDYANQPVREAIFESYGFKSVIGVPLKQAGEVEVKAVLLAADDTTTRRLSQIHLETLERFAVQAAITWQTSQLMGREQQMLSQLGFLHQISDYIQASGDLDKMLHAVLTGITAGYGLGFNRAALLLLDERRRYLEGRMGIGYLDEAEAVRDWAEHHQRGLEDFKRYFELLEQQTLPSTPVGERIREVRLPITTAGAGLFFQAMQQQRSTLVTQGELNNLPESFVQAFEPALPLIVAPLTARGQTIGLLVADNKFTQADITSDDEESLLTFVNTAAIAIGNTQLLAQLERTREAAKAIAGVTVQEDLRQTLRTIVQHAQRVLGSDAVTLYAYDEETEKFDDWAAEIVNSRVPDSACPPDELTPKSAPWSILNLKSPPFYRLAKDDVSEHELLGRRFVEAEEIRAAIGIQLRVGEQKLGVLFVTSRSPHHFLDDEIATIQLFADQAAVAIRNSRLFRAERRRVRELKQTYEDLKKTKGLVGARTALAWMGMASSAWRHTIDKHALTIREQTQLLSGDLNSQKAHAIQSKLMERLSMIDRLAGQILEKPIVPPLSKEEGTKVVAINDLIRERARQLWQNEPYQIVDLLLDLQLSDNVTIHLSPEWLRRAFDILVDNAVDAVAGCNVRRITIGTRAAEESIEIIVSDTGPGISEEVQAKIGLEVIEKPEDAKGLGMGLLMAQTIVQTYGGDVRVASTGPKGTSMVIWLSLKK